MKLIDFLHLVPHAQQMVIVYAGSFTVEGTEECLGCLLCEDVYNGIVIDVAASGDVLKVWVKEE